MRSRLLKYFLGFAVFFSVLPAISQKKILKGSIADKTNKQPIAFASIRNLVNGITVLSKQDGTFFADVGEGNILAFSANGFFTDTLTVSAKFLESGKLNIGLEPLPSTLGNVTITGTYNHYQNDSIARRKQFLSTVGENKVNAIGSTNNDKDFGIAINLDHFKKREKDKRKARSLFEITEEEAYINFRWNETVVEKYTNFANDELNAFIQKARPAYAWLRRHVTEEDLLYYINSQLKKMR